MKIIVSNLRTVFVAFRKTTEQREINDSNGLIYRQMQMNICLYYL